MILTNVPRRIMWAAAIAALGAIVGSLTVIAMLTTRAFSLSGGLGQPASIAALMGSLAGGAAVAGIAARRIGGLVVACLALLGAAAVWTACFAQDLRNAAQFLPGGRSLTYVNSSIVTDLGRAIMPALALAATGAALLTRRARAWALRAQP